MSRRNIDTRGSTITLRTRAKGLLSRLAHDLEIEARRFEGEVEVDGDSWSAELSFPVRELRTVGAIKRGRVDFDVLSRDDIEEIDRKIREEVLVGAVVKVRATGKSRTRGEVTIVTPGGEQRVGARLAVEGDDGAEVIHGELKGSLRALGVPEVKAPLGVFKVDDAVEIAYRLKLKAGD